jgi:hypothetical protein
MSELTISTFGNSPFAVDVAETISADIRAIEAWRQRELELAEIRGFSRNWDGRGSEAPTRAAMDAAALFLSICKRVRPGHFPARIALGPDGFLSVDWLYDDGDTLVRAVIQDDNEIEWMKATPGRATEFFSTPLTDETGSYTEQVQTWQPAQVAAEEPALAYAR